MEITTETFIKNIQKDLAFLEELKTKLIAGRTDPTKHEYAMNMIDDWINELTEILDSPSPALKKRSVII